MTYFLFPFLQAYKPKTWLVDRGHRHTKPKNLVKGGKIILNTSWFCKILSRSPSVTNK